MPKAITNEQDEFLQSMYRQYCDMIEKYGRRCVGYQANLYPLVEDAVQATFMAATNSVQKVMEHKNIPAWLKVTFRNKLLHELRDQSHGKELLLADPESNLDIKKRRVKQALESWETRITLNDVCEAVLAILTLDEQEIFNLYFLEDRTMEGTAQATGLTHDTVRGKIARIRRKLKNNLMFFLLTCAVFMLSWNIK